MVLTNKTRPERMQTITLTVTLTWQGFSAGHLTVPARILPISMDGGNHRGQLHHKTFVQKTHTDVIKREGLLDRLESSDVWRVFGCP